MAESIKKAKDVKHDGKALLEDTEALLEEAAKASGEKARDLYNQVATSLREAQEALFGTASNLDYLKGKARQVADRAKQTADTTDQYVHDHPWQSIGAAAAIGALIGMLIARR